jgi:hypothetical protein
MPGWRPRKVDCTDGITASDVSAVVVSFLDHLGGVEQTVGDPSVGDASALAAPTSRLGGLTRGQRAAEFSRAVQGFFWGKPRALVPTVTTPAGVVSLLRVSLWLSSPCYGSG